MNQYNSTRSSTGLLTGSLVCLNIPMPSSRTHEWSKGAGMSVLKNRNLVKRACTFTLRSSGSRWSFTQNCTHSARRDTAWERWLQRSPSSAVMRNVIRSIFPRGLFG